MTIGSDCTNTLLQAIQVHIGWTEARQHTAKIIISMKKHIAFDTGRTVLSLTETALLHILLFARKLLVSRSQMFGTFILHHRLHVSVVQPESVIRNTGGMRDY